MASWSMTRMQYAVGLGVLFALSPKLHSPVASLAGFAAAGILSAFRLKAIGRSAPRAFLPLGVAVVGTALPIVLGPGFAAAGFQIRLAALFGQLFIAFRAGIAHGAGDRTSPKQTLARTFLDQRRRTKRTTMVIRDQMATVSREADDLTAASAELAARIAGDPTQSGPDIDALKTRIATQTETLKQHRIELQTSTETLRSETAALRDAKDKWTNRNKAPSAPSS